MERPCDLHIHSCHSDGNLTPRELVERAHDAGLSAVSITDHDTIAGQEEAFIAGRACGVEILSGVEFSVVEGGKQVHILGYCYDVTDRRLRERARFLAEARIERARSICRKLSDLGIHIPFEEVVALARGGTVGRPHVARVLLSRGAIDDIQEAFDRYIGYRRPAFVAKTVLPTEEVVRLIAEAGGVSVWAHPGAAIRKRSTLNRMCALGVRGLEVWHPNHTEALEQEIERVALERDLIRTGGSDYHFHDAMKVDVGGVTAPYESANALREAASEIRHP